MSTELSSDAAAVNQALQDPAPKVDLPTSLKVDLYRGLYIPSSDEWYTTATVRELNGEDEEALSAFDVQKNVTYSEYMTHLLKRGVVSIGDLEVKVIQLRYPTGGDSQTAGKRGKTTAEQNTIILSRCAILEGKTTAEKEAWARGLSLADRNKLVKALFSAQPGPRMEEVETQCSHCNAKIVLALDWVALLFG